MTCSGALRKCLNKLDYNIKESRKHDVEFAFLFCPLLVCAQTQAIIQSIFQAKGFAGEMHGEANK